MPLSRRSLGTENWPRGRQVQLETDIVPCCSGLSPPKKAFWTKEDYKLKCGGRASMPVCALSDFPVAGHITVLAPSADSASAEDAEGRQMYAVQPCMLQSTPFGGETTSPTHPLPLTRLQALMPNTPSSQLILTQLQGSLYTAHCSRCSAAFLKFSSPGRADLCFVFGSWLPR